MISISGDILSLRRDIQDAYTMTNGVLRDFRCRATTTDRFLADSFAGRELVIESVGAEREARRQIVASCGARGDRLPTLDSLVMECLDLPF